MKTYWRNHYTTITNKHWFDNESMLNHNGETSLLSFPTKSFMERKRQPTESVTKRK